MKLKLYAYLVVGALVIVTHAVAAPTVPSFLAVDINGYNAGGGQSLGPTQAGYQGWEMANGLLLDPAIDWGNSGAAGLTKVFATTEGPITANLIGVAPGSDRQAHNRGVPGTPYPLSGALQDFVYAQNNTNVPVDPLVGPAGGGFGQNFIRLQLTGLIPNQRYQITMLAREQAFNTPNREFDLPEMAAQAYTDLATLGGLDGPGAWLNANVSMNATYLGRYVDDDADPLTPDVDTGYKNPIPTIGRRPITAFDHPGNPYYYSATFGTVADATGKAVIYTWSDANTYNGAQIQRPPS